MIFFDTETCGLHGPVCLIQWARDDGPINLHSVWHEPIVDTLKLIEGFCNESVCGFNLAFDWFHLHRLYNMLLLFPDHSIYPIDAIDELALLEPASMDGVCIKPVTAFDLMLHARKGPYQSTMDRNDIRIKRIPTPLAWLLADKLATSIKFKDIYFARKKDKKERWKVYDITNDLGVMDVNFKDIVLKFAPSSALKALAVDALGVTESLLSFNDVDCNIPVVEKGWAPYALAFGTPKDWKGTWPEVIVHHASHWTYNALARKYAEDDVVYTRGLYRYFSALASGLKESEARTYVDLAKGTLGGRVTPIKGGDDDSILACMVGCVRWKGYKIDIPKLKALKEKCVIELGDTKSLATAPHIARKYLESFMDETERIIIKTSTKKQILDEISEWEADEGGEHPAATAAKKILSARKAKKKIEVIDKLLIAGRFHASFKVIGTLSSRMSGTDGLNAQGIGHGMDLRSCFLLAQDEDVLTGGDFVSFEVTLADAEYNDPTLHADLLSGKKIHALLGQLFYPDMDYNDIMKSKGTDDDKYSSSKQGVFAMIYGGEATTLIDRLGVSEEAANDAYAAILKKYPQIGVARNKVFNAFCSMRQPGGIGSKVEWHTPADYVESMLGFRRYFTLENRICKTLFALAENPPKEWTELKIRVVRRDRQQTASGACRSALFAAAFAIQASNMRAAANHRIQSTGAGITKNVERRIWDLQPVGISEWLVQPMNIHDEIMAPCKPKMVDLIDQTVRKVVDGFVPTVPLIDIEWGSNLKSWAEK